MKTPAHVAPHPVQTRAVAARSEGQQFWSKARTTAELKARHGNLFPFIFDCSALSSFQLKHFCLFQPCVERYTVSAVCIPGNLELCGSKPHLISRLEISKQPRRSLDSYVQFWQHILPLGYEAA